MDSAKKLMYEVDGFREERPGKIIDLCKYLVPVMNEIHEIELSERFWVILLKDYAKTCVNRELLMSDRILNSSPAISPMNGWELPTRKDKWHTRIRELVIAVYDRHPISEINRVLKNNNNICVGIRGKEMERFGIGIYCPSYHAVSAFFLNKRLRRKLKMISEREESVFLKNVILQIPRYYVEDFIKNKSKIEIYNPRDKVFHAEHLSGMMDLIIALYVENGAKYFRYQFGGFMGEIQSSVTPDKYIDIDKLRTYGWKIHDKDEPHVAYRLEQFKRSYDAFTPKVSHDLSIVYNIVNTSNRDRYKSVSYKLFEKLDFRKYSKVLLRPRGITKKLDNSGELAFLNPPSNVEIGKGKRPIHEVVKASRVIVHISLPSTNFLECVYVDHPIVAILTVSNPTDIIKPYYQFFLDQKVMHNDINSLIEHLNTVDLETWWEHVIKEPMYDEFKKNFARKVE